MNHFLHEHKHTSHIIGTVCIVLFFFALFTVGVFWFRSSKASEEKTMDSIVEVLTNEPISETLIEQAIDTRSEVAPMRFLADESLAGKATRTTMDHPYELRMEVALPEIDRSVNQYTVWLIRSVPYDFFPLGAMTTNEEGMFVMEWEWSEHQTAIADEKETWKYTNVLITVQSLGGSLDPGVHVVEGEFGK